MYLYHGSNLAVNTIDLNECRNTADFGKGFYTTNVKNQAISWAKRIAIEHMGLQYNPSIKAVVTTFDFDTDIFKDTKARCLRFHGPSYAWALFVKNNLLSSHNPKGEHNLNLKYDLVSGYIATIEFHRLFANYESGIIDEKTLKSFLKAIKKTNQYSFHTPRSIEYLKSPLHEYFDVTKEEFYNFHAIMNCFELKVSIFEESECVGENNLVFNLADIAPLEDK